MKIRACRPADWPGVLALLRQLWPDRQLNAMAMRAAFRRGLRSRDRVYLCAVVGIRVVGVVKVGVRGDRVLLAGQAVTVSQVEFLP